MADTADSTEPTHKLDPKAVEWRLVDDEVIALDLRTSNYIALNPTGAVIWQALADGATETELVERLTAEFEVDADTARRDVASLVRQLADRELLQT